MAVNHIRPEFQVEVLKGKFKRPITKLVQDVKQVGHTGEKSIIVTRMVHEEVEFDTLYMLYFPQGHSMGIPGDDVEQLTRVGVFRDPKLVDMETGEEVPEDFGLTPKDIVLRKQMNRPRAPGQATGGLTDIEATME